MWEILSFKIHAENEAERLVSELILLSKKALYKVKTSGRHLSFDIFGKPWLVRTIKTNFMTFHTFDF